MMKKIILIFIFFSLTLFFCKNVSAKENFTIFYKQYLTNQKFQIERTLFPVTFTKLNENNIEYIEKKVDRSNWKIMKDTLDKNQFFKDIDISNNEISIVNISGIDTGIHIRYYFKIIKDKWYLYQISDLSK